MFVKILPYGPFLLQFLQTPTCFTHESVDLIQRPAHQVQFTLEYVENLICGVLVSTLS